MLVISNWCKPMSHEPRSFVSGFASSVGSTPDMLLPPGHMGLQPECMGLQPGCMVLRQGHVQAACVSGVLRTELDVGEHAQAAELRGQRTAHARLAQVQPRQPRQQTELRRHRARHVRAC